MPESLDEKINRRVEYDQNSPKTAFQIRKSLEINRVGLQDSKLHNSQKLKVTIIILILLVTSQMEIEIGGSKEKVC